MEYYGIYRAKVLNNKDPNGLGRVLVHIYELDGPLNFDESNHQWIPVLSPFGGVPQMGFYIIPPIHAEGFVIFENGNANRPVWIGSYPFSEEKEIDEEATQTAGYPVIRVKQTVPPETKKDPTTIVLKTQYPTIDKPDPTSDENIVENIVTLNENKLELIHANKSYYKYNPGGLDNSQPSSSITLSDDTLRLQVLNSKNEVNYIEITQDGVVISSSNGNSISVSKNEGIVIKTNETGTLKLEALSNGSVIIKARYVIIDGEQIVVPPGENGGGGVVTTDCVCPFVGLPIHVGSSKVIFGG